MVWLRTLVGWLHECDRRLSQWLARRTGDVSMGRSAWRIPRLTAHLGDSWLWLLVSAFLLGRAQWGDPTRRRERLTAATSLLLTLGVTAIVVAGLKHVVKRQRPRADRLLYGPGVDVHSFPSGHAARLAAIFVWARGAALPRKWLFGLLALVVGASRVHLGIHYVADVLAGYAVGAFTGWLALKFWRK